MKITKVPSGEFYMQKTRGSGFFFMIRYCKKSCGYIDVGRVYTPRNLVGKRVMFKIEVQK